MHGGGKWVDGWAVWRVSGFGLLDPLPHGHSATPELTDGTCVAGGGIKPPLPAVHARVGGPHPLCGELGGGAWPCAVGSLAAAAAGRHAVPLHGPGPAAATPVPRRRPRPRPPPVAGAGACAAARAQPPAAGVRHVRVRVAAARCARGGPGRLGGAGHRPVGSTSGVPLL